MRWEVHSKGSPVVYTGHAETASVAEIAGELWQMYINEAASKNAGVRWDHLRMEIWLDSGRIILFPASLPFRRRTEQAVCQVVSIVLRSFYDALIEADFSDEKLEAEICRKEHEIIGQLSSSAAAKKIPFALGAQSVRILWFSADSGEPIKDEILTWC